MICACCQTENAEPGKTCQSCGMAIDAKPTLALDAKPTMALAPAACVIPKETVPHPFANPRRARVLQGIKDAVTAVLMVPAMAAIGAVFGVLFFALVIGTLDHLYFHPELSRYYLQMLARKSLLAGLFAGIPAGAYGSLSAAGAFIQNAGKLLTGFCVVLALPFLIFPPFHFFPRVLKISSLYDPPPGIAGAFLLALPFLVFVIVCQTMFTTVLAPRRSGK